MAVLAAATAGTGDAGNRACSVARSTADNNTEDKKKDMAWDIVFP